MVKKVLYISFFLLSGCDLYSQDKVLDREIATDLINKKVATSCLPSRIDITDALSFNTLRRYYDAGEGKMKNRLPRDIITLANNTDVIKRSRMEYLTQLGFFEKISSKIYVGKKGIRGYYFEPIDYNANEVKGETTYEDEGTQYQLTSKGEKYIDMKSVPSLLVCIGKVKISNVTVYQYGNTDPDRIKVTFSTELYGTPEWLEKENTRLAFPMIIQNIENARKKSESMVYIVKYRNRFIIDNDEVLRN